MKLALQRPIVGWFVAVVAIMFACLTLATESTKVETKRVVYDRPLTQFSTIAEAKRHFHLGTANGDTAYTLMQEKPGGKVLSVTYMHDAAPGKRWLAIFTFENYGRQPRALNAPMIEG